MYNTLTRSFTSLLLVTGASAVVQNITSTSSPWFCHELDCPTYVVVRNTSSYEVRQYTAGMKRLPVCSNADVRYRSPISIFVLGFTV